MTRPVRCALAALLGLCLLPAPARAQWFPREPAFAPLLAAPREVDLRGSFIAADRPDSDFRGRNLEAEVVIGHRIPVVRLGPEGARRADIVLGFEVGVFSRFHMETSEKDLINTDFRVGAPLSARVGGWEGRLTLLHVSSHLGDDFLVRFPRPAGQVTRDGVEALLARRFGRDVRAYAGADLHFHANPGVERSALRAGLEWDASRAAASRGFAWPFVAVDLRFASEPARPAWTGTAGVALRVRSMGLRLEARAHAGPSPMGWLRNEDESSVGLGLRVEPFRWAGG